MISTTAIGAEVVSVNFVGSAGAAGTMGATDFAGNPDNGTFVSSWNNAGGTSGTLNGLLSSLGNDSGLGITWAAGNGTWQLPNTTSGTDLAGGANPIMMKGYLDSFASATPTVVTVNNLVAPLGTYDVIVYFDGDNGGDWRVGQFALSEALTGNATFIGEDSENVNFNSGSGNNANGLFQLPVAGGTGNLNWPNSPNNSEGNFILFSGVSGSSFTLSASPSAWGGTPRAAINGIQIVGVPEPSTIALLALGGMGLMVIQLRRRR
jgi:hypothetical protein